MSIRSFFSGIAQRIRGARISDRSISVVVDNKMHTVHANSANFQSLKEELQKPTDQQDADLVSDLVDLPKFIVKATHGRVQISEETVLFDGKEISNFLTDRILAHLAKGLEIKPLALFLDNVMNNPDASVRDDLFEWCDKHRMPLTDDGKIIAFKAVRRDYRSHHDGKTLHVLGQVTSMPRELCDTNRDRTCSSGLHWCSIGYLSSYGSGSSRLLVVVVDPADVTSIPAEYKLEKGRSCAYLVAGEVSFEQANDIFTGKLIISSFDGYRVPDSYIAEPDPVEEAPEAEDEVSVVGVDEEPEDETEDGIDDSSVETDGEGYAGDTITLIIADDLDAGPMTDEQRSMLAEIASRYEPSGTAFVSLDTEGTPAAEFQPTIPQDQPDNLMLQPEDQPETEETTTSTELSFTRAGITYTATEIHDLLEELGQRGTAKITGIPRTTLQEWRKAIDKHLAS